MLTAHFTVLTISGVWCPFDWSSKRSRVFYKIYSFVVIVLMYSLGVSQLARIIFVKQSFTDFNDTFFILLSTNFACFKAASNLMNQKQVIGLINMFEQDCCIAQDDFEKVTQKKYDNICRKIALSLLALVEVTALFVVVAPLSDLESLELPYKVLLPYDIGRSRLLYWLTFAHHTFGAVSFTAISITSDAIITGFMLQLCAQLDLLRHRLVELPCRLRDAAGDVKSREAVRMIERGLLSRNVRHHTHIFRMAETICTTFNDIIVCQFCISALEICVSVYQLSVRTTNIVELLTYALYLLCMLGQFFVYCYFGNEVTLQSKKIGGAIFDIDWTSLSVALKKDLTIMILRSSKPIAMSCGAFTHLTLESFTKVSVFSKEAIVKTSYSAFNFLKQSA